MIFRFYAHRFTFRAVDPLRFPAGKAGNVFRGAFGTVFRRITCKPSCPGAQTCRERATCAYARTFEPATSTGPSGLADPPRPFVFRAAHLDGSEIPAGEVFHIDVHSFDLHQPVVAHVEATFRELAREGLGARRSRVELRGVDSLDLCGMGVPGATDPLALSLAPDLASIGRAIVRFETATELKAGGETADPDFSVLFARIRDRVSTLRALYGDGPLDLDFAGMGARAGEVRIARRDVHHVEISRRSSRTGGFHGLGGIVGEIEYSGELREFVPFLRAAYWVGVGRHTVWGNGVVRLIETKVLRQR